MAWLNKDSIMSKVRAYAESKDGKKRIADVIDKFQKEGGLGSVTGAGSYIVTYDTMKWLADKLIDILKEEASSSLPQTAASVIDHFDSLTHGEIRDLGGGEHIVDIYFADDLSRLSLLVKTSNGTYRTGDGVENIVSLFDTGYKAKKTVGGFWEGHGYTRSVQEREGTFFIERAIERFNDEYGKKYNLRAYIPYNGFYSNYNNFSRITD